MLPPSLAFRHPNLHAPRAPRPPQPPAPAQPASSQHRVPAARCPRALRCVAQRRARRQRSRCVRGLVGGGMLGYTIKTCHPEPPALPWLVTRTLCGLLPRHVTAVRPTAALASQASRKRPKPVEVPRKDDGAPSTHPTRPRTVCSQTGSHCSDSARRFTRDVSATWQRRPGYNKPEKLAGEIRAPPMCGESVADQGAGAPPNRNNSRKPRHRRARAVSLHVRSGALLLAVAATP